MLTSSNITVHVKELPCIIVVAPTVLFDVRFVHYCHVHNLWHNSKGMNCTLLQRLASHFSDLGTMTEVFVSLAARGRTHFWER